MCVCVQLASKLTTDHLAPPPSSVRSGEALAGRGVCDPGAEHGSQLHRRARRQARRHQGQANQVRPGDSAEGDAAARRSLRLLRD